MRTYVRVTYPPYLRQKARSMRVEGRLTIDQIAERLALSRSTVFGWVRDIPIPREQFDPGPARAARLRGNRSMQAKYRKLREAAYEEGQASFDRLSLEPTFRDFVCLYIAEGYKRDRNQVALSNSDPAVIRLANRWIRRETKNLTEYRIQFHADQRQEELASFWAMQLHVEPAAILFQRKSNSSQLDKRVWRCKYGVLAVRTGDTLFRARLEAWMDRLREEWG